MQKLTEKSKSLDLREQELILAKEIISKLEKDKYDMEDKFKKMSKDEEKSRSVVNTDSLKRKIEHLERENGRLMKIIEQSEALSSHVKLEHEISRLKKEVKKNEPKDLHALEDQLKELKMQLLDRDAVINQLNPKVNKFKDLEGKYHDLQHEVSFPRHRLIYLTTLNRWKTGRIA